MSDLVFAPFWNESGEGQDQWDQLILAGNTWPGLADVSGSGVKHRIDVKKTKGKDGSVLKDNGMDPAKLKINLRIWTAEQWSRFNELLPLIHPKRKGGSREPTELIHPQANLLGIKAIYINQIDFHDLDRSNRIMTVTMSAIEWIPRPAPVKRGAGTAGGKATPTQDDILDALDPLINEAKGIANVIATAEDAVTNAIGNIFSGLSD